MWRIVTKETYVGAVIPFGLRNDDGYVCFFTEPTFWSGQIERYAEDCKQLRTHAEIMCSALNREAR